jgi:hypothetical protein
MCTFDKNESTEDMSEFRLIYTPDTQNTGLWKQNASNPGQFGYAIYDESNPVNLDIELPFSFVNQGAMPVHVYDSVMVDVIDGITCFSPGNDITSQCTITGLLVTLGSYSPQDFGSTSNPPINVSCPTGPAYVWVHLDYGLKKTGGYSAKSNVCGTNLDADGALDICHNEPYDFTSVDTQTVYNNNVFKHDPGIGGLVLDGLDEPVPGVTVKIYDSKNKLLATVYTDEDGWYMWQYKYTGKPATFTVMLPDYNQSQTVTLKSNGFLVVSFIVP